MTKSAIDSVREECAPYRNMSVHEKARLIGLVCADVPAILARYTPEHIARMYALDDRLPESTLKALARLRRQARTSR